MVKLRPFFGRKSMMIYDDNTIAHKITSSVSSDLNKCLHSSVRRSHKKLDILTINNGDSETTPLFWDKNNGDMWQ